MNFTMLCNCWWIPPCNAIVYVFYHVVELFVNFIMLCNFLWISPCCAIVCEFHHVVQLFVNVTLLCRCLWISSCCAIVCEFHHVMQLFVNFTMLCNCEFHEVVQCASYCWGLDMVLFRYCWVLLGEGDVTKKSIISLNEEYFLKWFLLTYQQNHFQSCYRN